MNQQLLNPFGQDHPEKVDTTIYSSFAQRCSFNHGLGKYAGHLLATGGQDGVVEIIDMDTKGVIRSWEGHVKPVESLSWSRNSRYLLSAARDWKCVIHDLSYTVENMPSPPESPLHSLSPRKSKIPSLPSSPSSLQHHRKKRRTNPTSPVRQTLLFDAPVLTATFHPRTSVLVLATLGTGELVLCDLREPADAKGAEKNETSDKSTDHMMNGNGHRRGAIRQGTRKGKEREVLRDVTQAEAEAEAEAEHQATVMREEVPQGDVEMDNDVPEAAPAAPKKKPEITYAVFHPAGYHICAGTSSGVLLIYDIKTRHVINRTKVSTASLKQIAFDRSGRFLVINSADRAVRVLAIDPVSGGLSPLHRFQDTINRTPWNSVGFSGDGEYVMGGAGTKIAHNIYIWDRSSGVLVKVLEGPKDSLDDCDWNPFRPTIASVTSAGAVNIWQTTVEENWSAFAPGFEELEENREYIEREDEFDIEDETEIVRRQQAEEEQLIDVFTTSGGLPAITIFGPGEGDQEIKWEDEYPDEDDRWDFFPSLDLEASESESDEGSM